MRSKRKKAWPFGILAIIGIIAAVIAFQTYQQGLEPLEPGNRQEIVVEIPSNVTARDIGDILEDKKVIRSSRAFANYARGHGGESLKAGEYTLSPSLSVPDILNLLIEGKTRLYSFTIPEGYTTRQIVDLLAGKGLVDRDAFRKALAQTPMEYDYVKKLPANENRLEGFLFPATYRIQRDTSPEEIVRMLVSRFDQEMTPEVRARMKELNIGVRDTVVLASLIEREAQKAEDRPVISAVFRNRLNKGMKLEACSTIQYLLGQPKAKLYYKDLQIESPYNTYKYAGLPPGPIANPGKASLQAALYPTKTDYLYFVAKGDGYHQFSRTFNEHLQAVAKYGN
ncbi:endolytic transglycosylase MltG [Heliobacterium undosum]|uniref:Endolytic murein transglycosylase n=1 Tax=Heliomicrobium undosum TaxID=121734 RepID=A0A845L6C7_9FIRM|nr:endolytic transglycosylase MltG [Heliomicrobium undosum]MZP31256.1 endolytic transglycosylase MltG [Heliomicrobium undosum]